MAAARQAAVVLGSDGRPGAARVAGGCSPAGRIVRVALPSASATVKRSVGLVEREPPTAVVHEVVMAVTERDEVVEIGETVELPEPDMVDLAPVERRRAALDGAGAVDGSQRSTLLPVGGSPCSPQ